MISLNSTVVVAKDQVSSDRVHGQRKRKVFVEGPLHYRTGRGGETGLRGGVSGNVCKITGVIMTNVKIQSPNECQNPKIRTKKLSRKHPPSLARPRRACYGGQAKDQKHEIDFN